MASTEPAPTAECPKCGKLCQVQPGSSRVTLIVAGENRGTKTHFLCVACPEYGGPRNNYPFMVEYDPEVVRYVAVDAVDGKVLVGLDAEEFERYFKGVDIDASHALAEE